MSTTETIPGASHAGEQLSKFIVARDNPTSLVLTARTAVAAVVSFLIARLFRLPEAYWAPISTVIGMQSTLGAALPVSVQYFAGTAIGAAVGAVTATYFSESVWAFGVAVLIIGLLCAVLRVERGAYRYATTTLVIVMLVTRSTSAWRIGIHRFFEVSIGIAVGLVLSALWPERQSASFDHQGKS
ncbi:MAG TPA: FUSC family protein [Terriglobales bacterium]|nr:FUSC family protein [Terriglobales bacterium]